ncbi:MAG: nicotinamide-nucleotide amidohydrolase family protein, partial [Rhodospirillales bacterium]|nr:nicotinamide-nucleotide amidohydrolase family protein [Rhodospirillales bacterium]
MYPSDILDIAQRVLDSCDQAGLTVITAESCTGGLIAGCLTSIPGSSHVFERGYVTYANKAKSEMLGVPEAMIAKHGAVSEPVARAMAEGALNKTPDTIA